VAVEFAPPYFTHFSYFFGLIPNAANLSGFATTTAAVDLDFVIPSFLPPLFLFLPCFFLFPLVFPVNFAVAVVLVLVFVVALTFTEFVSDPATSPVPPFLFLFLFLRFRFVFPMAATVGARVD